MYLLDSFTMTKTVEFNVGGKRFEVGWSTLEMHPESLLTQMVSDAWERESNHMDRNEEGVPRVPSSGELQSVLVCDEDLSCMEFVTSTSSEFFIDRDGEIFSYVLNYLRDLKVSLPLQVTKASLLNELEFYKVEQIYEENIDENERRLFSAAQLFNDGKQRLLDTAEKLRNEGQEKIFAGECTLLANYCIKQFVDQRTNDDRVMVEASDKDFPCLKNKERLKAVEIRCNTDLNKIGLHISSFRCPCGQCNDDCDRYICQRNSWNLSVEAVALV